MRAIGAQLFYTLTAGACCLGLPATTRGGEGHAHGGVEAKTEKYHFEAVFMPKGATLYVHDLEHKAVDLSRATASATFFHPAQPAKPWFSRPLKLAASHPDQPAESFAVAINLAKVPAEGAKVAFRVEGLPDPAAPTAEVEVPFTFAAITMAKATRADRAAIAKLKVCPVSGDDLGAMGGALKVSRGDQSTFICCEGCLKDIQADPEEFFAAGAKPGAPAAKHDH